MVRVVVLCTGVVLASCEPLQDIERPPNPGETASSPMESPSAPEAPLVATAHPMASDAVAQHGYDDALEAEPPPSQGSSVRTLRLTRSPPTVDALQARLEGMLVAMSLELEPAQAAAWAQQAHIAETSPDARSSIAEPRPGIVVTYDAWFDDLSVVDTTRLAEDGGQVDTAPWAVASAAMDALVAQGIIDTNLSFDEVSISYARSGVKGPDGTHERWIDEVRFEANGKVDGTAILDMGVRVGVTPKQRVSSLRVTRIEIERQASSLVEASEEDLRHAFVAHVVESTSATLESVLVSARRPVYMLDPRSASTIVAPRYMIDYTITVGTGDDDRMGSRAKIVLLSLTHAPPSVELELP